MRQKFHGIAGNFAGDFFSEERRRIECNAVAFKKARRNGMVLEIFRRDKFNERRDNRNVVAYHVRRQNIFIDTGAVQDEGNALVLENRWVRIRVAANGVVARHDEQAVGKIFLNVADKIRHNLIHVPVMPQLRRQSFGVRNIRQASDFGEKFFKVAALLREIQVVRRVI